MEQKTMNITGNKFRPAKRGIFAIMAALAATALLLAFSACGFFGDEGGSHNGLDMGTQQGAGTQTNNGKSGNGQGGNTQGTQSTQGTQTTQSTQGSQNTGTAPAPFPQPDKISFQLPKGWEWHDQIPNKARSDHDSKDGVKPWVLFELYDMGKGTEADAKKLAQDEYAERQKGCDPQDCATNTKYQERKFVGYNLYISAVTSSYWGNPSWYSSIFFVKNGYIFAIELDDLLANETAAVESALTTLKTK